MNIECRRNVLCLFYKKLERSDSILRHSIFDILRFCGSLFNFVEFHTSGVGCQGVHVLNDESSKLPGKGANLPYK